MMHKQTYKDAGVDLESYQDAMRRLPPLLRSTHCPRVMHRDGGFAGLFQLDLQDSPFARNYKNPVLVSCTDGVGTKLKVAQRCQKHDTVGIDLVAMSVNDALCCGAEPLFFLDYVALGKDDPDFLEQVVRGISHGCREAACALLGGETAIMPDIYQPGDYDLAGFCVGVVEKDEVIDGRRIEPGNQLLAIASSGLHSNGYSLARKVVFDVAKLDVKEFIDPLGETVGDALLRPTKIYAKPIRRILTRLQGTHAIRGIAHITGGGIAENLARILPKAVQATIQLDSWKPPAVFPWLRQIGSIDPEEMLKVFNMGIGMVLVVDKCHNDVIRELLAADGEVVWNLGEIEGGEGDVNLRGNLAWTKD
jgi:phosphoribosylformylglycinamidine cyclo-ligase